MSVSKRNKMSLPRAIALLLASLSFQSCSNNSGLNSSSPTANNDGATAETTIPLEKIPTKDCLFNGVTYQCVVISYGSNSMQDYELWLPTNPHVSGDRPLVIYTHGGGYWKGDRADAYNKLSPMQGLLNQGYAFATINYRLSGNFPFEKGVTGQYPAEMQDAANALQDLRMRASHYGYNPEKVALTGESAGSEMSLWLAFHDDLKDASSAVARDHYSTRVPCVAVADTQTTVNIGELAPLLGPLHVLDVGIPGLYGFTPDQYNADPTYYQTRYAASMYEASAISHISADDNVNLLLTYMLNYGTGNIHSPEFGDYFTKGTPAALATQFARTSLTQLNKPFTLKTNRGNKITADMIAHINGCF